MRRKPLNEVFKHFLGDFLQIKFEFIVKYFGKRWFGDF